MEVRLDDIKRCINSANEVLRNNYSEKPKYIIYPKSLVDKFGMDKTLELIKNEFGYVMTVKSVDNNQYLFEEIVK